MPISQEDYHSWGTVYTGELSHWGDGVLRSLERDDRIKLISVQKQDGRIGFIAEFSAEIPQRPPVDIRKPERLIVVVGDDRLTLPEVYSLRKSFPTTPHAFLRSEGDSAQLCLFDEQYRDLRHDFTPIRLVNLIFDWLRRASIDQLHLPGQPLEPFIFAEGTIVLDRDAFQRDTVIECWRIDGEADFFQVVRLLFDVVHHRRGVEIPRVLFQREMVGVRRITRISAEFHVP